MIEDQTSDKIICRSEGGMLCSDLHLKAEVVNRQQNVEFLPRIDKSEVWASIIDLVFISIVQ